MAKELLVDVEYLLNTVKEATEEGLVQTGTPEALIYSILAVAERLEKLCELVEGNGFKELVGSLDSLERRE